MNTYKYATMKDMQPTDPNLPLTMCMADTMDRKFQNGGDIGRLTGPRSVKCQTYMAERCAKEWDGFCEYFYKENNTRLVPNYAERPWESKFNANQPLTIGNHLLRNAGELKYCTYANCESHCETFDPTRVGSGSVTKYEGACVPVCRVTDIKTLNQDPLLNRMIDNPEASAVTLINLCNTSRREGTDLKGTRLGELCERYFAELGN